ncbi:MAG: aminodeoxychorismate/anthranilate synthase component II [Bacteroidetes bacterium]|nr:aminodeoxychorismate/anthranilate synthase component II [Bacteroidota bacterium]
MKLLILDNYDSFTYNLAHLVEKVSTIDFDVIKNDKISIEEANSYSKIMLSPGPGLPKDAGIMPELIKKYYSTKEILGVCLGFQAIGEHFNSPLKNLETVFHGLATPINVIEKDALFKDCPTRFNVGRYHSWVIDENKINADLIITAKDDQGKIMAARHKTFNVTGVQFHPESILSEYGETIIKNWLYL